MKQDLVIIADAETVNGFKLAGVGQAFIFDESNNFEKDGIIKLKDKIIFMSAKARSALEDELPSLMEKNIVQEIPGKDFQGLSDLIRETIGFDLDGG